MEWQGVIEYSALIGNVRYIRIFITVSSREEGACRAAQDHQGSTRFSGELKWGVEK